MKKKAKKWFISLIKLSVSALAIWFVISRIDTDNLISILAKASVIPLIIATVLFILSKMLSSLRLGFFFEKTGLNINKTTNLRLYWLGMFYNLFLPGGIGGDAYKIYLLHSSTGISALSIGWAVLIDRINGMMAIVLLTLVLVPILPLPTLWKYIIPISAIPAYLMYIFAANKIFPMFKGVSGKSTLYSLGVQILQCICVLFIKTSLNINADTWALLLIFMISSVVAVLPFTIGGIGSREIVFLFGSQWLGIDSDVAITISLLFFIITAIVSLGGVYYQFRPGILALSKQQ